jgi:hypothetical protein
MRKTFIAIAAAVLASSGAWAATDTCQPIGDATVCSDGTIVQPFGDGAYVTRTPRDSWGQPRHDIRGEKRGNQIEPEAAGAPEMSGNLITAERLRNEEEPGA